MPTSILNFYKLAAKLYSNVSPFGNPVISVQSICLCTVGKVPVTTAVYSWEALEDKFHTLKMGGRYYPANCTARHRVAIVLPFRDREMHLKVFLNNLHPFLQNQQLDYGIFIVDLVSI